MPQRKSFFSPYFLMCATLITTTLSTMTEMNTFSKKKEKEFSTQGFQTTETSSMGFYILPEKIGGFGKVTANFELQRGDSIFNAAAQKTSTPFSTFEGKSQISFSKKATQGDTKKQKPRDDASIYYQQAIQNMYTNQ